MENILLKYIPEHAVAAVVELIKTNQVHLKIVSARQTKHGDYRQLPDGSHLITVNASGNKYRFFITLIHEIAHLVAFKKFGRRIKPHGAEWKHTFQQLMLPFINPSIFPSDVLTMVALHFKNPTASSDTDIALSAILKKYDPYTGKHLLSELSYGQRFIIPKNRIFVKGMPKVKRFACTEELTGKTYLFNPNAEVEVI